ncbi:MAG TPA: PKD domain-containing protein [Thermoplasmata archaeon]|nr:PKD domain-containing protein [Thermoplasmata archaeon]
MILRGGRARTLAIAIGVCFGLVLAAPLVLAQGQAILTPPHSDQGVDTDGDSLFNVLTVYVRLNATVAGTFIVAVDLYDSARTTYITGNAGFASLSGPSVVPVDLYGLDIWNAGIDGPYAVDIAVYDDTFNLDDTGTHTTGAYLATNFDPAPAAFAPPHSDSGVDTDGDTMYDILRVSAVVNVTDAGTFDLTGTLLDSLFFPIESASIVVGLGPGSGQTIDLDFEGWKIRANGVDGPYLVDLVLSDAFTFTTIDADSHTTASYAANQFDLPPAFFSPPHADRGVDTDGDTLFNALEIDVHLQIDVPGEYVVEIYLWDSGRTAYLGFGYTIQTLATGPQDVTVSLSTIPIVLIGVPGPYIADMQLRDEMRDLLDQGFHTTQAYTVGQFDPVPATFAPPHSDQGVDRDVPPDGEFNVLSVGASVDVTDAGIFSIYGYLWDGAMTTPIDFGHALVSLAPGVQTVSLNFSGVLVRNSGFAGPYLAELYLDTFVGGSVVSLDSDLYLTSSYLSTDFQSVTPATLSGTVRDRLTGAPVDSAEVLAFDFRNNVLVPVISDSFGFYALPLYQGDWVVTYDHYLNDAVLRRQTLTGDTTVDIDLPWLPVSLARANVTHGPWDTVAIESTFELSMDAQLFRVLGDWQFGNRDEYLSQSEWDTYISLAGPGPPAPSSTEDFLQVDGVPFALSPGTDSFGFLNVPGPIDSATPPTVFQRAVFTNATVTPAPSHTIDLNVSYDQPLFFPLDASYLVVLPAGFVLQSYTAPPDVAVNGVGTGTVLVDPGWDPDPFDGSPSVWIRLIAGAPDVVDPVVVTASADPDPVLLGNPVTISATVTDDVGVSDVRLQAWGPTGSLGLDVGMTGIGGDQWEYGFAPDAVGVWTFSVTGQDLGGNTAVRTGQFRVIELNAPTVTGAAAAPNPQEYAQPVTFAATVSDDSAVDAVSIEVRDASGGVRGNFTMSYNAASGKFETTQTVGTPGVNSFTVWANDTSDNWASASGTFVVQDTTAPSLSAAGASPDPVEVGSTVTIAVTANDSTGVTSVTVEIRDPSNAIVGTFPMTSVGGGRYEYDYAPSEIGTFSFTISASDAFANTATGSGTFDAQDSTNPMASAGPDQSVRVGVVVTFEGSGSTDNYGILNYTWTFTEGGQTRTLFGDSPTHAFASAGTYDVTLRVTDESGNWAEDVVRITITVLPGGGGGIAGVPSWAWIVIALLIVAVLAAAFILRRRKPSGAEPGSAPREVAPVAHAGPQPGSNAPPEEPQDPALPSEE